MKFLYTFIASLFCFVMTAQQPFVTTWEATVGDLGIFIAADAVDYTYDYTVDLGDGTILTNQTNDVYHVYSSPGTYTISISGLFPKFDGTSSNCQLITIEQWGDIQWQSMANAFASCPNLTINATDTPDLSNVTDMSYMFKGALSLNSPTISNWDVSNVTNMEGLFQDADNFNQPLNNWNVSNVTNMNNLFKSTFNYDQPLDNWDVSNVTDMNKMFLYSSYNQPLNSWDVSNVTDMTQMFRGSDFNQPLSNWDTSSVTTMKWLFRGSIYNLPLNSWDVSNVTNMVRMFEFSPYNHPLDNWNTANVTDMNNMFNNSSFNHNINSWDVSNVTKMNNMFISSSFNKPLNNWDVSNVTNMSYMFRNSNFNQPLNSWDVSNVTAMNDMFLQSSFNQPLNNWDVSSVTTFNQMFSSSDFNQDISSWTFTTSDLNDFIANSEMDSQNYDLLLGRFVQLELENGDLDAYGLNYCDIYTRQILNDDLGWIITDDELADDCNINYISGKVQFDENNNGCDSDDEVLKQLKVNINNGQDDLSVITDDQGDYIVTVNQGNFDVSMLNLPDYFDASPASHNISFNDTDEIEDQKDFCITANQSVEDLSIEVFPLDDAIPGFESEYEIIVKNFGTQTQNNIQVDFSFENTYQSFVSASQSANQNGNSLSFDISSLSPFTSETINLTLLNVQPPNLNSGDVLSFDADVSPNTNDINPDDNTVNFDQTVVNSFDPNDKLVTQGEQIPDEKIDEYLDYKIRFQNVGTANAINVVVTDTISDKLDWTTFQPINSSHNYRLELVEQEEINFIFENINLPYEAIDEPGSNGHVSFKIKPKSDVQIGDIIENKAYIFFDFNAPIITNTVSTEIVDELSTTSFVQAENIKLSPNPAEDQVEIINASNATIQSLQLYSIKGQLIYTFTDKSQINVSQLNSGVYILQVETQHNKINKRLIKR